MIMRAALTANIILLVSGEGADKLQSFANEVGACIKKVDPMRRPDWADINTSIFRVFLHACCQ